MMMMMMMMMMKEMPSSSSPSPPFPIAAARRLVPFPATPLVRRRRRRGGEVVVVATSSPSSSSSSSVVKSRQKVKETFPEDILRACERCEKEFELRAELDARNPDARALRVGDVLSSCSESSIAFLERDVEDVVREYRNFFEEEKKEAPKKVVVSLSLLRRTLCTKLHVDYVPLRAMTTYFGRKTEVLDERSLVHKVIASAARESASWALPLSDALKSNAKLYERKLVAERGESCDILFLKGEMWQSGKASVHRSPETTNGGWRLVLRVDEYDAVNQAEEHQQCLVNDDDECGCEE